jgi:hypothetical protein
MEKEIENDVWFTITKFLKVNLNQIDFEDVSTILQHIWR